jgi:hypothetical protein
MDSDPAPKRMRLRYPGHCRLCGATISARTEAIYEPATKTVHCVICPGSPAASPAAQLPVAEPTTASIRTGPATAVIGPGPVIPDALRFRTPGSAVIAATLLIQADSPPRTAWQRFFGRSPLSAEAQSWFLGATGELEVGRILDGLSPEWHALHSIPIGTKGSDIDHLVIGPGGVFTINTKHHDGGKLWVGGRRILVNGQRTDHLRNAEYESARAAKVLGAATGLAVEVTPILAIVGANSIQVKEKPARVEVLRASALVRRIERSTRTLTAEDVAALVRAAVIPTTWSPAPPPDADLTAFAALRGEVVAAWRRRRAWAAGGILGLGGILAVAAAAVIPAASAIFR